MGLCVTKCDAIHVHKCLLVQRRAMKLQYVRSAIVEDCSCVTREEEINLSMSRCLFDTGAVCPAVLSIVDAACGSLTFTKCRLVIVNKAGNNVHMTVDGLVPRANELRAARCTLTSQNRIVPCHLCSQGTARKQAVLSFIRIQKKQGRGRVLYFHCDNVEPLDVKFKNCSKCDRVCYCCKQCQVSRLFTTLHLFDRSQCVHCILVMQVADWKAHKLACARMKQLG